MSRCHFFKLAFVRTVIVRVGNAIAVANHQVRLPVHVNIGKQSGISLTGYASHCLNIKIKIMVHYQLVSGLLYRFSSKNTQIVIVVNDVEIAIVIDIREGRSAGEKSVAIGHFFYSFFPVH